MSYRVSVITSIYRSQKFLFDWFLDIKRQSIFPECEFILLDCNNDDFDFSIIEKFLPSANIKYHKLGYCSVYEAWNKGVELSSSNLLTNWNTDDRRSSDSLSKQVLFLENNADVDVCYGPTLITNVPNEIFEFCQSDLIHPVLESSIENLLKHNSPHCLPMWRKSIHDRFGLFDTSYFSASDYDMWLRVLFGGGKMHPIEDIVGLYYRNPSGISSSSSSLDRALKEVFSIRKKYT
jgi:hypothetical protein